MSKNLQYFYVGSVSTANRTLSYAATSNFNTLGIDLSDFDDKWTLQVSRSATDGTPTVTLQVSNDNSNWVNYQLDSTNVSVRTGEMFIKNEFQPRYLRVAYTANSATGTVTIAFYK